MFAISGSSLQRTGGYQVRSAVRYSSGNTKDVKPDPVKVIEAKIDGLDERLTSHARTLNNVQRIVTTMSNQFTALETLLQQNFQALQASLKKAEPPPPIPAPYQRGSRRSYYYTP
jgi:hypothetical protein